MLNQKHLSLNFAGVGKCAKRGRPDERGDGWSGGGQRQEPGLSSNLSFAFAFAFALDLYSILFFFASVFDLEEGSWRRHSQGPYLSLYLSASNFLTVKTSLKRLKLASLQCRLQLLGIEQELLSQSPGHCRSQLQLLRIEPDLFIVAFISLPAACHSTPSHWNCCSHC